MVAAVQTVQDAYKEHLDNVVESWRASGGPSLGELLRTYRRPAFDQLVASRLQGFSSGVGALATRIDSCQGGVFEYLNGPQARVSGWRIWKVR